MNYKIQPELNKDQRKKLNNYSDIISKLLFYRNITDNESANKFLNPDYDSEVHDPNLLKNIDIATDRILEAINKNQKICIFSDYDADGIPGAVILHDYFKKINYQNFFNYIPHRNKEGFGMNLKSIEKIKEKDTDLIITIDCGITDFKSAKLAKKLKMDLIITDHHQPHPELPDCLAIINPKLEGCEYPEKELCGAGVIFKVVQALIKKDPKEVPEGWEKWLLDMVGIATMSDMVPLIGENRVFAKYGLLVLKKSPRKGLIKLLRKGNIKQNFLNEEDIGFSISPRINAASRMDSPEIAFQMLSTEDDIEANESVNFLDKINNERKGKVAAMVKEINKFLENHDDNDPIIVKGNPDWQPSLLGLAASSVVEKYNKPAFLWGRGDGDNLKGSCRSDGSVSLVKMMQNAKPDLIYDFGGHDMAGGFAVHDDAIHDLLEELSKAYHIAKDQDVDTDNTLIIDEKISINHIDENFIIEQEKLGPFGVGNHRPIFVIENIKIENVVLFGKEKNHLKLIFKKDNGQEMSAIKFFDNNSSLDKKISDGDTINLIFTVDKSYFGYRPELRMKIIDWFK